MKLLFRSCLRNTTKCAHHCQTFRRAPQWNLHHHFYIPNRVWKAKCLDGGLYTITAPRSCKAVPLQCNSAILHSAWPVTDFVWQSATEVTFWDSCSQALRDPSASTLALWEYCQHTTKNRPAPKDKNVKEKEPSASHQYSPHLPHTPPPPHPHCAAESDGRPVSAALTDTKA
jgi:hypothetical protein